MSNKTSVATQAVNLFPVNDLPRRKENSPEIEGDKVAFLAFSAFTVFSALWIDVYVNIIILFDIGCTVAQGAAWLLGCSMAQSVMRWPAIRQARVQIPARRETSNEEKGERPRRIGINECTV